MSKKRIVCFGDSNTWGYDPVSHTRYDESTRWTMVLQRLLGDAYQIIEEGQNGRTIASADPWEWGTKCGMDYVLPMIESHNPFDLLVIMLGSNDLKKKFHLPAADIAGSLQNMLMKIKGYAACQLGCPDLKILIVAPPAFGSRMEQSPFASFFDCEEAPGQIKELAHWYAMVAEQFHCSFFDASVLVSGSEADRLHLSPESHRKLAEALRDQIITILEPESRKQTGDAGL